MVFLRTLTRDYISRCPPNTRSGPAPNLLLPPRAVPPRCRHDGAATGESTVEETTLGLLPNPFEKHGIKVAITYIGELIGNPTGSQKQRPVYEDRTNLAVDADLEKLIGAKQLTFHANIFQIDGGGLSRGDLLNYMVIGGIEALPTTRLYEMWLEQNRGPNLR